jgi:hypothetical protein
LIAPCRLISVNTAIDHIYSRTGRTVLDTPWGERDRDMVGRFRGWFKFSCTSPYAAAAVLFRCDGNSWEPPLEFNNRSKLFLAPFGTASSGEVCSPVRVPAAKLWRTWLNLRCSLYRQLCKRQRRATIYLSGGQCGVGDSVSSRWGEFDEGRNFFLFLIAMDVALSCTV